MTRTRIRVIGPRNLLLRSVDITMDVKQLRYFLGVFDAKSITKAADLLFVAQPALGLQIRKLEEELGVELFSRHSRGVTPTEAGIRLANRARVLLSQFERVKQDILDFAEEPHGRVAIGMTPTTTLVLAAAVADRCREAYPEITLNILEGLSERPLTTICRVLWPSHPEVSLCRFSASHSGIWRFSKK